MDLPAIFIESLDDISYVDGTFTCTGETQTEEPYHGPLQANQLLYVAQEDGTERHVTQDELNAIRRAALEYILDEALVHAPSPEKAA